MIFAPRFNNATFGVCAVAFVLFACLYEWAGWWSANLIEGSRIESMAAELRFRNWERDRWNASVVARWEILHPDDPQKAMRESEKMMAEIMEEPTP